MNTQTIDIEQIKQRVDLRELAATYTTLHRESVKELAGPCPKCGGADRFHVTETWFTCRQCHPKRGDCFGFMQWQCGVSFKEAAAMFDGGVLPMPATVRAPSQKQQTAVAWDAAKAEKLLDAAQAALWDNAYVPAHDYLEKRRGLDPHTWLLFGLGYQHSVTLPNTWDKEKRAHCHPPQPAIVIPWYAGGRLVALRYRFLEAHTYIDLDDKERTEKQTSRGHFAGHVFGGQAMDFFAAPTDDGRDVLKARTLVICEGELNAMSVWQIAHNTRLDALSLGSEGQTLTPKMIEYAQRYRLVILWTDRKDIAKQLMAAVPGAYAVTSEMCEGQDANDLLRANHLGGYLSSWRFRAAKDDQAREALLYNLWDAAQAWHGVDAGTQQVMEAIGQGLGQAVTE